MAVAPMLVAAAISVGTDFARDRFVRAKAKELGLKAAPLVIGQVGLYVRSRMRR